MYVCMSDSLSDSLSVCLSIHIYPNVCKYKENEKTSSFQHLLTRFMYVHLHTCMRDLEHIHTYIHTWREVPSLKDLKFDLLQSKYARHNLLLPEWRATAASQSSYVYVCMYVRMYVCMCVCVHTRADTYSHMHTDTCTDILAHIHTKMYAAM